MSRRIVDIVESQVISSVIDVDMVDQAIKSQTNVTFLLAGDILTVGGYIARLKAANKKVFLHMDFIEGFSNSKSAIRYVKQQCKPDGIISTKSSMIRHAKEEGLLTIQRIFLIDRNALKKGLDVHRSCKPDAIEVLPGLMPRIIHELTHMTDLPIIAGGLIETKEDILQGLEAGALAISAGNEELWNLGL